MRIEFDRVVPSGEKLVEIHKFLPDFMVRNKLSSKPQKAVNKLKEMVEGPNSIVKFNDVSMRQDYSQGTVTLNLLGGRVTEANGELAKGTDQGKLVVRSTVLPATAAVKRYTTALKEMVEKPFEEKTIQTEISNPKKKWYEFWK